MEGKNGDEKEPLSAVSVRPHSDHTMTHTLETSYTDVTQKGCRSTINSVSQFTDFLLHKGAEGCSEYLSIFDLYCDSQMLELKRCMVTVTVYGLISFTSVMTPRWLKFNLTVKLLENLSRLGLNYKTQINIAAQRESNTEKHERLTTLITPQ